MGTEHAKTEDSSWIKDSRSYKRMFRQCRCLFKGIISGGVRENLDYQALFHTLPCFSSHPLTLLGF